MNSKIKMLSIVSFIIFMTLINPKTALAATYTLSGRVTDQSGTPIADTLIEVLNQTTGGIVASGIADSNGDYATTLEEGTYDIRVTPPSGSGFSESLSPNQIITSDTILDFILIPIVPPEVVTLSGSVLDPLGNGLPGQIVRLSSAATSVTDSSGAYSLEVAPGDYELSVEGSVSAPQICVLWSTSNLSLNANMTMDITLPAKKVSVHVQDPAGNPVANVDLHTNRVDNSNLTIGTLPATGYSLYHYNLPVSTNANGDVDLWLIPTPPGQTYTFTATPPPESGLVTTSLPDVNVSQDTSVTIVLPFEVTVTLSGSVLDPLGNGLPGQIVRLSSAATSVTDSSGAYSLEVAPGDYELSVEGSVSAPQICVLWSTSNLSLNANMTMDITLPAKKVSVHVQDPAGNPVANVDLHTNRVDNSNLTIGTLPATGYSLYHYNLPVSTNANGDVDLWLIPTPPGQTYTFTATPPPESGLVTTSLPDVNVSQDTSVTIVLPFEVTVTLSGSVLDPLGNGLPGQIVRLYPAATSVTDPSGAYSLEVAPGDYELIVEGSISAPQIYVLKSTSNLSLTENRTMDITLPAKKVSVHVQDPAGNPVADVDLHTNRVDNSNLTIGTLPATGYSLYHYNLPVSTNANGDVDLWLIPTPPGQTYTFTATPPPESPYATFHVYDVTVLSDKTIIIVLEFVHDPPVTVASVAPEPNEQGVYPDPTTVTLSATATQGFTVAATYYNVDGEPDQTYSESFVITGDGTYTVEYWSVDNIGVYETPKTLTIEIVSNQPPTAQAGGPYNSDEGSAIVLSGASVSDPDNDPLTISWGVDSTLCSFDDATALNPTLTCADNGSYIGTLTVDDGVNDPVSDSTPVSVSNVASTVDTPTILPESSDEGGIVTASATFTDPAGDLDAPYTCTVDYGNGELPGTVAGYTCTGPEHTYAEDGAYPVTISVTDKDGDTGQNTTIHTVNNIAPAISTLSLDSQTIDEGWTVTLTGSFVDLGVEDTHDLVIVWGDGYSENISFTAGERHFQAIHPYLDDDPSGTSADEYTIVVTVTDDEGDLGDDSITLTVNNVDPVLGEITAPLDPVQVGTMINAIVDFTDAGVLDTHTAVWDWGDDSTSQGEVDQGSGSGIVTGSHIYTTPGVYTLEVAVTDDDLGAGISFFQYIVVYDPDGGFVTGGGWFTSPLGAYYPDPTLTGKATFGFVSKYKKGATIPTGNTEFQFKMADLNFHSSEYQWLVVTGSDYARFKGSSSINGNNSPNGDPYKFMIWAGDREPDTFRIKIWWEEGATENIVYDNGMDQEIGGGNIVVHTK